MLHGYKPVRAAKRSESWKDVASSTEGMTQSNVNYLHHIITWSRFIKKSSRKSKDFHDLLHIQPSTTGGPPPFKSQRRYQSKNYCIPLSIQKISSVHKLILKMPQILRSYELTCHGQPFLITPTKILNQLLAFLNLYQHAKKSVYSICSFWDTVNFKVPWSDLSHWFLTMPTQKFWSAFNFCESLSSCKKSIILFLHSSDTVSFRVPSPDWSHPLLTMPVPKIFNHILICMNLHQHAKNQLIASVPSWDTIIFRVQRPYWPQAFLTMPYQKIFDQLNFCEFISTCKKMRLFHSFVLEK